MAFFRFASAPGNEAEVAFVGDIVSDMPDDERFSEICRLCIVENYLDAGCDLPPNLWAESSGLKSATRLPVVANHVMHI